MKVLITGANGQLAKTLQSTVPIDMEVVALTRQAFDISDETLCEKMIELHRPNVVINTAAYNQVDKAETDKEQAYAINASGPGYLAKSALTHGARLIHVSTDYVFSGAQGSPYKLDSQTSPISYYGETKYLGEKIVLDVSPDHLVFRTAWVYSRYDNNFVTTMLHLLGEKEELSIISDQVSTPTWTGSLAEAIWRSVSNPGVKGLQHLTDAGVATRYDFVCAIKEKALRLGLLQKAAIVKPIQSIDYPQAAARPCYSVLDKTPTWNALSINPVHWEAVLEKVLKTIKRQ